MRRRRGGVNLLHQEEVDLLKTVILSPRLPSTPTLRTPPTLTSRETGAGLILCLKCLSTLSKLTSCIVSAGWHVLRCSRPIRVPDRVCVG